jgi:hypothetical protein
MFFSGRAEARSWHFFSKIKASLINGTVSPRAYPRGSVLSSMLAVILAVASLFGLSSRASAEHPGVDNPAGAALLAAMGTAPSAPTSPGTAPATSAASAPASPATATDPKSANCAVYGTVMDNNGGIISGATVTLTGPVTLTTTSDADGNFSFTKLPAGDFNVKVTGKDMNPADVSNIDLPAGGIRFLPPIELAVAAATTSVKVYANPEVLAEQQVQMEMHQRVLGVLPDYYTSYDWNAVHMYPKQKFQLGFHSEIDTVTFMIIGAEAGIEQYYNRFPEYGTGIQGYAKRYGAAYATDFTGTMIADVALPSIFHQDPRYFFKGTGSFGSRAFYAVTRSIICRGDNGHDQFDYSRVLGNIAAGGISNLYYPPAERGVGLTFSNAAIDLAANASTNLIREFILPGLSSHEPARVRNKAIIHF